MTKNWKKTACERLATKIAEKESEKFYFSKTIPVLDLDDGSAEEDVVALAGVVNRMSSELEQDSQLQESFWAQLGVSGATPSLGELSWA